LAVVEKEVASLSGLAAFLHSYPQGTQRDLTPIRLHLYLYQAFRHVTQFPPISQSRSLFLIAPERDDSLCLPMPNHTGMLTCPPTFQTPFQY